MSNLVAADIASKYEQDGYVFPIPVLSEAEVGHSRCGGDGVGTQYFMLGHEFF